MSANTRIATIAMAAAFCLFSMQGQAQTPAFPSQRITVVVPAVAGGATDIIGRIMSQHLTKTLGQSVIVENRGGASGSTGALAVVRAAPDGHTLLLANNSQVVINQYVFKNIGYDPLTDLVPVAFVAEAPEMMAVNANFPAQNFKEFIAHVKANPGKYNYGSPGVGTPPHLAVERIMQVLDVKLVHVPFRGSAAAMTEVAANNIQMSMATLASIEPFRQAKTARIIGIASKERLPSIPDVPTLEEQGFPNLEMAVWWGVLAPKGTPPDIVRLLNTRLREAFSDKSNTATLEKLGIATYSESIEMFQQLINREAKMYQEVVKNMGLEPQ
jgi:tripartite-type tricarboxylate transporter receptor subunit TctC